MHFLSERIFSFIFSLIQMSFFDPVYQCDQITMESESEISESERRRATLREKRRNESNETLDTLNAGDSQNADDSSVEVRRNKKKRIFFLIE